MTEHPTDAQIEAAYEIAKERYGLLGWRRCR